MIGVAVYGLFGCLLGIIGFLLWRSVRLDDRESPFRSADLPPRDVVDRIFAKEDWEFARCQPKYIYRQFLRDRRTLAIRWISQIRMATGVVLRIHARDIRQEVGIRAATELRLLADYLAILFMCEFLSLLVRGLGVFRVKAVVSLLAAQTEALRPVYQAYRLNTRYDLA